MPTENRGRSAAGPGEATSLAPARERLNRALPGSVAFDVYSAFTRNGFGGNPAGVVLSKEGLPASTMQRIASELGVPTTGFAVVGDTVAVRYFTPSQEIDACGHVTLAVAAALARQGSWGVGHGDTDLSVTTRAGVVPIRLSAGRGDVAISLSYRPRLISNANGSRPEIEASLGGVSTDARLPVEIVTTGLRHLLVPFRDPADLSRLKMSTASIVGLARRLGFETLCAFAYPVNDLAIRMRDLCAAIGALEEPASGTTSAALGDHLHRHLNGAKSRLTTVIEQGVDMGSPSRIEVSLERSDGEAVAWVTGRATRTLSGTVAVDGERPQTARSIGGTAAGRP